MKMLLTRREGLKISNIMDCPIRNGHRVLRIEGNESARPGSFVTYVDVVLEIIFSQFSPTSCPSYTFSSFIYVLFSPFSGNIST